MKDEFIGQTKVSQPNEDTRYIKSVLEYEYDVGVDKCKTRIIHYKRINKDNTGLNIYIETSGQTPTCGMNSGVWSYEESGEEITRDQFLVVLNQVKKQLSIE